MLVALVFSAGCAEAPGDFGGAVAAASPEATEAGLRILEAGGNAIDAAVAVQFALAVTEPAMSGLGGQTQILFQRPGQNAWVINGTSFSPANTPEDATAADVVGHRATTVPATVRTLDFAWRNFGSGRIAWEELLDPAIEFAELGFVVGPFRAKVWARYVEQLAADPATAELFLDGAGAPPDSGSVFHQPVLAQTLRRLATSGAQDFYTGQLARDIARDMETRGGWITFDDLASVPEPSVIPALTTTYHGFTVASLPPPGGGWVVLQILNLFEVIGPETLRAGAEGRTAAVADALRIGHTNRRENPVHDLINYHASVEQRLDKETARMLWERRTEMAAAASAEGTVATGETTHFSVVDRTGMAVSVTASINAFFGARAASAALGFLYNDYMHEFELGRPEHPFALGPSRMPYSSMSPTVVSWNGEPVLALGSPGSARIISTVAQVAQLWMDGGLSLDAAVAAARIHVIPDDRLYLEGELGHRAARQGQVPLGYTIMDPGNDLAIGGRNAYFGGVHAIGKMDGQWQAVADPRRDGRGVVLR